MKKDNKLGIEDNEEWDLDEENQYSEVLETFKKNIKKIRKDKGYKAQDKFAPVLGVSFKTLQAWENLNKTNWPSVVNLLKICERTGCDLDSLLGRIEEPTHDIKFIREKTGLSVETIEKLISLKGTGAEDLLSDIATHKNAAQLLRFLMLASDEDEIAWMNLDEIPHNLLSDHADNTHDISIGLGSDVAGFLVNQELSSIVRDIREKRKQATQEGKEESAGMKWGALGHQYIMYREKAKRAEMLEQLETDCNNLEIAIERMEDPKMIDSAEKKLKKISALTGRIRSASFAEWKRGTIEKEYNNIYREEINDNGEH